MIKKILFLVTFFMILGCSGGEYKSCKIVYTFENPSLGPKYGYRKVALYIKNKQIVNYKALDNKDNFAPGIKTFKKILRGETKDLNITYNSNGSIKIIKPIINKKIVGGSFVIKVIEQRCR